MLKYLLRLYLIDLLSSEDLCLLSKIVFNVASFNLNYTTDENGEDIMLTYHNKKITLRIEKCKFLNLLYSNIFNNEGSHYELHSRGGGNRRPSRYICYENTNSKRIVIENDSKTVISCDITFKRHNWYTGECSLMIINNNSRLRRYNRFDVIQCNNHCVRISSNRDVIMAICCIPRHNARIQYNIVEGRIFEQSYINIDNMESQQHYMITIMIYAINIVLEDLHHPLIV